MGGVVPDVEPPQHVSPGPETEIKNPVGGQRDIHAHIKATQVQHENKKILSLKNDKYYHDPI